VKNCLTHFTISENYPLNKVGIKKLLDQDYDHDVSFPQFVYQQVNEYFVGLIAEVVSTAPEIVTACFYWQQK